MDVQIKIQETQTPTPNFDNICCICLDDMNNTNNHNYVICKHIIHQECYTKLILSKNYNCPLCRNDNGLINIINYNIRINRIYPENITNRQRCITNYRHVICMISTWSLILFIIIFTMIKMY
jgi:hypothetical protein